MLRSPERERSKVSLHGCAYLHFHCPPCVEHFLPSLPGAVQPGRQDGENFGRFFEDALFFTAQPGSYASLVARDNDLDAQPKASTGRDGNRHSWRSSTVLGRLGVCQLVGASHVALIGGQLRVRRQLLVFARAGEEHLHRVDFMAHSLG